MLASVRGQHTAMFSKIYLLRTFHKFQTTTKGRFRSFEPGCLRFQSSHELSKSPPFQVPAKPIDVEMFCQRACVAEQCRKRCTDDSDAALHRIHQDGPYIALWVRCSPVGIISLRTHQKKSLVRGGALSFQISRHQFKVNSDFLCIMREQ